MYKIIYNKKISSNSYEMAVIAPLVIDKFIPGQFCIVMGKEDSERIPLTIYDTDKVYVKPETQYAYNTLCENIKSLTGDKHKDYVIKFLNSVLVDTFGVGISPSGHMLFKDDDLIKRKIDHKGHTECGYWFEGNGESVLKTICEICEMMPDHVDESYAFNIGNLFTQILKKYNGE